MSKKEKVLFQKIHLNVSTKAVLFQAIQSSISTQISFIKPIDRALPGTAIPGQSGPVSDGIKGVLCIPQSSRIIEASPSDCLVSYPGHTLWRVSYPFSRGAIGIFYSHPLADWVNMWNNKISVFAFN